jgi:hypothetical protein
VSGLDPGGVPVGLAVMRGLQAKAATLAHENAELRAQVAALRHLVGEAFAEGFQARDPDADAPWLVDWLGSRARARLDVLRGHTHGDDHGIPDAEHTQGSRA